MNLQAASNFNINFTLNLSFRQVQRTQLYFFMSVIITYAKVIIDIKVT